MHSFTPARPPNADGNATLRAHLLRTATYRLAVHGCGQLQRPDRDSVTVPFVVLHARGQAL